MFGIFFGIFLEDGQAVVAAAIIHEDSLPGFAEGVHGRI